MPVNKTTDDRLIGEFIDPKTGDVVSSRSFSIKKEIKLKMPNGFFYRIQIIYISIIEQSGLLLAFAKIFYTMTQCAYMFLKIFQSLKRVI